MSHSNTALSEQDGAWIAEMAGRLRLIQADALSSLPEKRREYLQEEITRSLKDVAPGNRKRYLDALLARFPVAGQVMRSLPAQTSAPVPASAPVAETPDQILERLLAVAGKLSEEKRAEISKRLCEAGLVWVDRETLVLEISDKVKQKLGLQNEQQPHLAKVVELMSFLVESLSLLDQNALKTMRELNPRNQLLNRGEDFRKTAGRYLTGEADSLESQWNAIRALIGGLFAAVQGGGKEFGRQYVGRMAPDAIKDIIESEGGKLFGKNKSERCWDRYHELFEDYATPDLVERKIKDSMAAFVERAVNSNR